MCPQWAHSVLCVAKEMCGVGDWVACDQSGAYFCAGDVCCPNGNTCPSGNQNTAPNCGKKTINCAPAGFCLAE